MKEAEKRLKKYLLKNQNDFDDCFYEGDLDSDIEQVLCMLEKIRKYSKENINVCKNRINSPFCNIEKASKELRIHLNYLEILEDKEVQE